MHKQISIFLCSLAGVLVLGGCAYAQAPMLVDSSYAQAKSCTEALITWKTNEPTVGTLTYWRYASDVTTMRIVESSTDHSVFVSVPAHATSASYRFMITPENAHGEQLSFSGAFGFDLPRCMSMIEADTLAIAHVQGTVSTCTEKALVWETNRRAKSTMTVTDTKTGEATTIQDDYYSLTHSLTFIRPRNETSGKYTVTLVSQAEDGSQAVWPESGVRTFVLSACNPDVGFSHFKIINQSCQDVDIGWNTNVALPGIVRMWRLADPSVKYQSVMTPALLGNVGSIHMPGRTEPEGYGVDIILTMPDGRKVVQQPNGGVMRMYACVPH